MFKNLPLTKILLSVATLSVVAVAAVGGTFANFTATPTTMASNAFASGSLSMTRSGSGAIFNADAMKIGDSLSGSVTITNTGTLPGAYTRSSSAPRAVSISTGTSDKSRMRSSVCQPSSSGIDTSRTTRSGGDWWKARSPARPSGACSTVRPARVSSSATRPRMSGSSSITRTRPAFIPFSKALAPIAYLMKPFRLGELESAISVALEASAAELAA